MSLAGTAGLVGRERELEAIEAALATGAVLVEGEPGIGKTTLWTESVRRSRERGAIVLTARPSEAERELPYAVLGDLVGPILSSVRHALPEPQRRALEVALLLAEPDGPPPDARGIGLAVASLVGVLAADGAVVVAIDDAQWADAASAAALSFAFRRLAAPVLVASRPAGSTVALPDATRVVVGPLSVGALHRLINARTATSLSRPTLVRVHEVSGGNPFYALELARSVASHGVVGPGRDIPIPKNLRDLVRARLESLPPEIQRLLEIVAALADATTASIDAIGGEEGLRGLAEAAAAGIVEVDGERVRFTHPLLAATAIDVLGPTRLLALHARLASVVTDPDAQARHLALSADGPNAEVAAALDAAAARAEARGAPSTAADLLELAASLTPAEDLEHRWGRLLAAANAHFAAGATDRADAILRPLVDDLPTGEMRARALLRLAHLDGDVARALERIREGIETAGETAAGVDSHRNAAVFLALSGAMEEALVHARLAAELAEAIGQEALLAMSLADVALTESFLGLRTEGLIERALELERRHDDIGLNYGPSMVLGLQHLHDDRLDESREVLSRVLERIERRGDLEARGSCISALANAETRAGRWHDAAALADLNVELAEQAGIEQWQAAALVNRARPLAALGQVDRAREDAEVALALAGSVGDVTFGMQAEWLLGTVALSTGDVETAARLLGPLPSLVRERGYRNPGVWPVGGDAVEALAAVGDVAAARREADALADAPTRSTWARAVAARCSGLVAAAEGRLDEADELLTHALAISHPSEQPFERARTQLAHGTILRRAKRKAAARAALTAARLGFEDLGAILWVARADDDLRRISGRARTGGLTATEENVAALVAQGRTNKEIAAALFVAVRTVEANLTRIYQKLGVRSRAELVRKRSEPPGT